MAFAVSLLGRRADAEDIVQDCYSRLLAHSDRYDLPRDGSRLLMKSISNACINFTQRRRAAANWEDVERPPQATAMMDPGQRAIANELEAAVAEAIAELPITQRAVVELRSWGHSLQEIADMLELTEVNARVLLHRARTQLALRLAPYLEEPCLPEKVQ